MQERDAIRDDITVLILSGRIVIGSGDADLRETVQKALASGARRIVLDMSGVTRIDSSGIGELVSAHTSMVNRGGRLAIAGLSPRLATVLQVTQLVGVLEVHDTVEEAAASITD